MTQPGHAGTPLHDPRVLRAIAHPVRNRILDELTATGPARAADLASALGIPANSASFHLRQLAKYGVVQAAPEAARDRRDRVWKLTAEHGFAVNTRELEADPETAAASRVWMRAAASRSHELLEAAYTRQPEELFRAVRTDTLRLSQAEARELADELGALVAGWAERTRGHDPGRRTYHLMTVLQPYPELIVEEPGPAARPPADD
jgi:predicted ArsR family transcriptional regulator